MMEALTDIYDIRAKIHTVRGRKIMLDRDLADLYEVPTKRLNEQIKRNAARFPEDFMFQLNINEVQDLRSQFATANIAVKSRVLPYVFTEHGVTMLSSVLNSDVAITINIKIVRAFVELRQMIAAKPEYELLKETVKRIESSMLIENKLVSGKMSQLSKQVQSLSELFDTFQDTHIVIRQPEKLNEG